MTIKENIKDILECNFSGFKDMYIEAATTNIMELFGEDIPKMPSDKELYGFLDLDIGDFFYNTRAKFYGIKVSRYMYFDIEEKCLSRLDHNYITNNKIYFKCDYEVW